MELHLYHRQENILGIETGMFGAHRMSNGSVVIVRVVVLVVAAHLSRLYVPYLNIYIFFVPQKRIYIGVDLARLLQN